jgi:hypothetical protein
MRYQSNGSVYISIRIDAILPLGKSPELCLFLQQNVANIKDTDICANKGCNTQAKKGRSGDYRL